MTPNQFFLTVEYTVTQMHATSFKPYPMPRQWSIFYKQCCDKTACLYFLTVEVCLHGKFPQVPLPLTRLLPGCGVKSAQMCPRG